MIVRDTGGFSTPSTKVSTTTSTYYGTEEVEIIDRTLEFLAEIERLEQEEKIKQEWNDIMDTVSDDVAPVLKGILIGNASIDSSGIFVPEDNIGKFTEGGRTEFTSDQLAKAYNEISALIPRLDALSGKVSSYNSKYGGGNYSHYKNDKEFQAYLSANNPEYGRENYDTENVMGINGPVRNTGSTVDNVKNQLNTMTDGAQPLLLKIGSMMQTEYYMEAIQPKLFTSVSPALTTASAGIVTLNALNASTDTEATATEHFGEKATSANLASNNQSKDAGGIIPGEDMTLKINNIEDSSDHAKGGATDDDVSTFVTKPSSTGRQVGSENGILGGKVDIPTKNTDKDEVKIESPATDTKTSTNKPNAMNGDPRYKAPEPKEENTRQVGAENGILGGKVDIPNKKENNEKPNAMKGDPRYKAPEPKEENTRQVGAENGILGGKVDIPNKKENNEKPNAMKGDPRYKAPEPKEETTRQVGAENGILGGKVDVPNIKDTDKTEVEPERTYFSEDGSYQVTTVDPKKNQTTTINYDASGKELSRVTKDSHDNIIGVTVSDKDSELSEVTMSKDILGGGAYTTVQKNNDGSVITRHYNANGEQDGETYMPSPDSGDPYSYGMNLSNPHASTTGPHGEQRNVETITNEDGSVTYNYTSPDGNVDLGSTTVQITEDNSPVVTEQDNVIWNGEHVVSTYDNNGDSVKTEYQDTSGKTYETDWDSAPEPTRTYFSDDGSYQVTTVDPKTDRTITVNYDATGKELSTVTRDKFDNIIMVDTNEDSGLAKTEYKEGWFGNYQTTQHNANGTDTVRYYDSHGKLQRTVTNGTTINDDGFSGISGKFGEPGTEYEKHDTGVDFGISPKDFNELSDTRSGPLPGEGPDATPEAIIETTPEKTTTDTPKSSGGSGNYYGGSSTNSTPSRGVTNKTPTTSTTSNETNVIKEMVTAPSVSDELIKKSVIEPVEEMPVVNETVPDNTTQVSATSYVPKDTVGTVTETVKDEPSVIDYIFPENVTPEDLTTNIKADNIKANNFKKLEPDLLSGIGVAGIGLGGLISRLKKDKDDDEEEDKKKDKEKK